MKFSSILALYPLFWSLCLFFVLPFRLRSSSDPDVAVAGQMNGAPPRFSFKRTVIWTTWLSLVVFGLYYLNYVYGWVTPQALDFFTARRGAAD